jgi:hypothetical protein
MRVVVSQFEGIDATPVLPLAAGCLVATARADAELAGAARFEIALERQAIANVVGAYRGAGILGFSLYPWNAAYSLAVAAAAREAEPEALIVVGGPSVPRRPERAQRFLDEHPAIDVLVFAEGELSFRELVRARLRGEGFDAIPGIAIRREAGEGAHRFTAPPGRVHDFAPTASPYLDGTFDELFARHRGRFAMALCETNRGCPFSCTFCDWSLTKHVVEFPIERVLAELDWVAAHGLHHVMLADANFGIRPRDAKIARYLAALKHRTGSPTSFYWYLTKNNHARNLETIEILQEAGIGTWVGLAVQDFDDGVLAAVKRDNIQTGESLKLRQICGDRGIPTFNELILGLPGQTYDSFTATVTTAMPGLPRHDFVLFLCRLIDNTELGDPASRARFGLETRRCLWKTSTASWDPIVDEFQEVVVATNDLPLADWERAYRFAFLAAALYNLRLLRVVLRHLGEGLGVDLRAYLAHLADRMSDAAPGSIYAELGTIFDRYVGSMLGGGPFVLPAADLGDASPPVYVDEAVATTALRGYDAFLAETEAHTRAFLAAAAPAAPIETVAEGFRYQAAITPRCGACEPVSIALAHDWPAFASSGSPDAVLAARPTQVRFVPPTYAAVPTYAAFVTTHLGCIRARLDIGEVTLVEPAVPTRGRPRSLIVLPASG